MVTDCRYASCRLEFEQQRPHFRNSHFRRQRRPRDVQSYRSRLGYGVQFRPDYQHTYISYLFDYRERTHGRVNCERRLSGACRIDTSDQRSSERILRLDLYTLRAYNFSFLRRNGQLECGIYNRW